MNTKTTLFTNLTKAHDALSGTGLGKIPGLTTIYDHLFQGLYPYDPVIEVQGSKMYLNVHEPHEGMRKTFQVYALNKIHEPNTTQLFRIITKKGNTVVDFGANIGYFSLLEASLVGETGCVYAFEPEFTNFRCLLTNIELNNYVQIVPTRKAIADKAGTIRLYICPYDTGHHTIGQFDGIESYNPDFKYGKQEYQDVETITLDSFFEDKNQTVDIIKMDAEGSEMLALKGMKKTIDNSDNLKMVVEFFPMLLEKMGSSPREFAKMLLDNYGFTMFVIEGDYAMEGKAVHDLLRRINTVDELMGFCGGETDHVNLYLTKK